MNAKTGKSWTDLDLEQYMLGELDEKRTTEIRIQITSDAELRERVEQLQESSDEILDQYTPEYMAQQIQRKQAERQKQNSGSRIEIRLKRKPKNPDSVRPVLAWSRLAYALPVLMVATFAFLLMQPDAVQQHVQNGQLIDGIPIERMKGDELTLSLYRKTEAGQEILENGAKVSQGDVVQLRYSVAQSGYGLVFSIDGNGVLTEHLSHNGRALFIEVGESVALNHAYELDNAPTFERFFLVFRSEVFDLESLHIEELTRKLRDDFSQDVDFGKDSRSTSLLLRK
ncbi:MAG: hypothetical protein OEZ43_20600 [Gammaproteobacteria bacterium]|nr:hypothetical protein [Gammaproteobacteria bacterium]